MKNQFVAGVALGVVLSFVLGALHSSPDSALISALRAQTADSNGSMIAVSGKVQAGNKDVLYLVDTSNLKLAVYEYEPGRLNLGGARNIQYDLQLDEYPFDSQRPDAREVYELVRKKKTD